LRLSQLWSCLDSGDVLSATFFFHQTQLIFNGIADDSFSRSKFLKKYQSAFFGFSDIIIDYCWSLIENVDTVLDESKIAISLICISIMKKVGAQELLNCFLNRRYQQLLSLFEKNLTFSQIILLFFKIIFDTSKLVYVIFWDQGSCKSLLLRKSLEIPKLSFSHEFLLNPTLSMLVSKNISNLRLETSHLQNDVPSHTIVELFKNWMEQLKANVKPKMSQILADVTSIGTIFSILKEVDEMTSQEDKLIDWEYIFNSLLGYNLNIWNFYLKETVMQLLKKLSDAKLNQEFQSFKNCINSVINDGIFGFNILSMIWDEDVNDRSYLDKKTFGTPDNVFELCQNLNSKLNSILEEMSMMDEKSSTISLVSKEDSEHFKLNFLTTLNEQFKLLLDNLESYTTEPTNPETILMIARLTRNLMFFCPNIKACFYLVREQGEEAWFKVKQLLESFSYQLLVKYLVRVSQKYIEKLREDMKPLLFVKFVEISLNWEEIKLEELLEDGRVINSTIRIPFQISIPIFECINSISCHINSIGAHTLPRKVINEFLFEIALQLNSIYQELYNDLSQSNQLPSSARQTRALQLYFDLLFFEQSLINLKNDKIKKEAVQLTHSTINSYQSLIDPFDLHVYYSHLQTALAKSIKSTSLLFGTLFCQSSSTEGSKMNLSSTKSEFHNSMAFYCLNNNFPLLNLTNYDKSSLYTSTF